MYDHMILHKTTRNPQNNETYKFSFLFNFLGTFSKFAVCFIKQGVCDIVTLPFTFKKRILKGKKEEEFMKTQIFHHAKIYNLPKKKIPLNGRNQNPFKIFL